MGPCAGQGAQGSEAAGPIVRSAVWGWSGDSGAPSLLSATDPSPGGNLAMEERLAQEALEALQLEKRLSTLSHAGRSGSGGTASSAPGRGPHMQILGSGSCLVLLL